MLNLIGNPTSVGQTISSLNFAFSNLAPGQDLGRATEQIYDFSDITVDGNKNPVVNPPTGDDWVIVPDSTGTFSFCRVCKSGGVGGKPDELLIGAPDNNEVYSNANGSIYNAGFSFLLASGETYTNGPLLGQDSMPTWTLSIPGLSGAWQASSLITSVVFGFGTSFQETKAVGVPVPGPIPEPAGVVLTLTGAGILAVLRNRRRPPESIHAPNS